MSDQVATTDELCSKNLAQFLLAQVRGHFVSRYEWLRILGTRTEAEVISAFARNLGERITNASLDKGEHFFHLASEYQNAVPQQERDALAKICSNDIQDWFSREVMAPKPGFQSTLTVMTRFGFVLRTWLQQNLQREQVLHDTFRECLVKALAEANLRPATCNQPQPPPGNAISGPKQADPSQPPTERTQPGPQAKPANTPPVSIRSPTPSTADRLSIYRQQIAQDPRNTGLSTPRPVTAPQNLQSPLQAAFPAKDPVPEKAQAPSPQVTSGFPQVAKPGATSAQLWQWKPVPEGPDQHSEYAQKLTTSPEGYQIVGARVRGKKHKHEGTNCDDWFETSTAGKWTLFAVADGGGSYRFSRVGARAACEAAISHLKTSLTEHKVGQGATESTLPQLLDSGADFIYVREALKKAMAGAFHSIEQKKEALNESPEHTNELNRPLTIKDLYTTLLLAVHCRLELDGKERSFVMACAAGDGMLCVINQDPDAKKCCSLLMDPDSGEFSGEVEFLCDKTLSEGTLALRIRTFVGSFKALMLMTDGVSDDYFPNAPGMAYLYADLILNRIIAPVVCPSNVVLGKALAETNVRSEEQVKALQITVPGYRILPEGAKQVTTASLVEMAKQLNLPPESVAANQPVLAAACEQLEAPFKEIANREDRLVEWLDAYTVRGSFDDRTLVVMAP